MKRFSPAQTVASLFALFSSLAPAVHAQYTNGQAASTVLGQSSFNTGGGALGQSNLNTPKGVVFDSVTGKLFVVDTGNNRILRFSSVNALNNGASAEIVFGQATFTTGAAAASASGLNTPVGAALDSAGNLWVADSGNNRVLRYSGAAAIATNGPSADLVLGQVSPASGSAAGVAQNALNGPNAVAFSPVTGSLFVADKGNNRVLRFDNPSSLVNGTLALPANVVFGQSNFLANSAETTAFNMDLPHGVAVDSSDNLWVVEYSNNRVLRFNNASSAASGASANAVIGQTDFTSKVSATTSTGLAFPIAVMTDSGGRLYVSDYGNNRVLIYSNAASLGNGAAANFVLGQTDFTSNGAGLSATNFSGPYGLSLANGYLWVSDSGASNSRALSFAITPGTPVVTSSPLKPKLVSGKSKTFKVTLINSSVAPDSFKMAAIITSSTKKKKVKSLAFTFGGQNITQSLLAGTFVTPQITGGQSIQITVKVTPRNASQGGKGPLPITFSASSTTLPSSTNSFTVQSTIKAK